MPSNGSVEIEEVDNGEIERFRDLQQTAGRDAANATLVFVDLLRGDPDPLGKDLLRQPLVDTPRTDALRDQFVDQLSQIGFVPDTQPALFFRQLSMYESKVRSRKLASGFCRARNGRTGANTEPRPPYLLSLIGHI